MAKQTNKRNPRSVWATIGKGLITLTALSLVGLAATYIYFEQQLPNVNVLKDVRFQVPLRVFTADEKLIAEYGDKRRIPIPIDAIPKPLIDAILATEDQRFYQHPGIDPVGLLRAAWQLVLTGEKDQGGSTITMQVARNFFLSRKKTYTRKLREILLAIKIDKELSKRKILELYLNKIYLGNRAYGVGAAATVYYGKPLNELTLVQFAMIAGLPKAPSAINPIANPEAALKRRNHVLSRMLEEHYIDETVYQTATNVPITASYHGSSPEVNAPYIAEMARTTLLAEYGDAAYTMGLKIYTTIDSQLQKQATRNVRNGLLAYSKRHGYRGIEQHHPPVTTLGDAQQILSNTPTIADILPAIVLATQTQSATALLADGQQITLPWSGLKWARPVINAKRNILGRTPTQASDILKPGDVIRVRQIGNQWRLTQLPIIQGALVALNPSNGALLALVGGFNFNQSKFNRAIQAQRQPGSAFKPFIYSAALEKGLTLASIINDAPIVIEDASAEDAWRPNNDNHRFHGPTRLRYGIIHSTNLVTVRLLQTIGIPFARQYLQRFGFVETQLPNTLSLALGSGTVTPLELAQGYASFANGGYKITPHFIQRITDDDNDVLYQAIPNIACATCYTSDISMRGDVDQPLAPRIISPRNAYLITSALQDVIKYGTGRRARTLHRQDLAGKTGTTNKQVDAWFSGFNGDIVLTVWTGFDAPRGVHEYGQQLALPIWIDFMKYALANRPEHSLSQPPGIVTVRIDRKTGLPASTEQQDTKFELFRKEYAPKNTKPIANNTNTPTTPISTVDELMPEELF